MNWKQASSSVRRTKVRGFVAAVLYVSLGHSFLVSLRITDNYFWLLLAPCLSHREAGRWPQAAEMSPLRKIIIISFFLHLRLDTFDIQTFDHSFLACFSSWFNSIVSACLPIWWFIKDLTNFSKAICFSASIINNIII